MKTNSTQDIQSQKYPLGINKLDMETKEKKTFCSIMLFLRKFRLITKIGIASKFRALVECHLKLTTNLSPPKAPSWAQKFFLLVGNHLIFFPSDDQGGSLAQ